MKKRILGLAGIGAMAAVAAVALASCGGGANQIGVSDGGEKINIQCWNEEGRRLFNKYVSDEGKDYYAKNGTYLDKATAEAATTGYHYQGKEVVWTETPSKNGAYQQKLDAVFDKQASAAAADRVDLILAEADYIIKYANDTCTTDITKLGVDIDLSKTYNYTVQAASDANGVVKGVSFQCCPSAMIYNRNIAKDVLGTDDPAEVQKAVSDWTKFTETAAKMKEKGYYMTACEAETYRVFSNNAGSKWVENDTLAIPDSVQTWMDQAKNYVDNGYTVAADVWSPTKTQTVDTSTGNKKAFACFGPAWYYNFCLHGEDDKGNPTGAKVGDWAITTGPQTHFWGGTWILAADGTDNAKEVGSIMNDFINNEAVLKGLVEDADQFTNNQTYNAKVAAGDRHNTFLGGQNDTAIFLELAKKIEFKNATVYDQYANEKFQEYYREYLIGTVDKDTAIANFKSYMKGLFPNLK